jgi:eukaryotic-like serine/threonine-protein kinase
VAEEQPGAVNNTVEGDAYWSVLVGKLVGNINYFLTVTPRKRYPQVVAIVLLAMAIAGESSISAVSVAKPVALPPPVGHSVDPCAFARPARHAMSVYGPVVLDAHYGNFDRCDLRVRRPGAGGEMVVEFQLEPVSTPSSDAHSVRIGALTMVAEPADNEECHRLVYAPNWYVVDIGAKYASDVDLCQAAGVAVSAALSAYTDGSLRVPRQFLPQSLANVDACGLLDADALTRDGVDPTTIDPGFGDWRCDWGNDDRWVRVEYDQGPPPISGRDGTPLQFRDRTAFVQLDPDSSDCVVQIDYRSTDDPLGGNLMEIVRVTVNDHAVSQDGECAAAKILASDVITHLPGR